MPSKQKNMMSYERYAFKKSHQPDYLCNIINKFKHLQRVESIESDAFQKQMIKRKMNEKRIQQIKRTHKCTKITEPQPYIKRTWVSPLEACNKKQQFIHCSWKKNTAIYENSESDLEKAQKVCKVININKKLKLFGQFMYSEFQGKQNSKSIGKILQKDAKMDIMHKQYSKLMNSMKKCIIICDKNSILNKIQVQNPLQHDKYYRKIMRQNDAQLTNMLLSSLSTSSNFTFSSFISFYQLFIWQQASKQTQIQFVLKLLMNVQNSISIRKIAGTIDFLCERIKIDGCNDGGGGLQGFNQVMKKLIFGVHYQKLNQCNQKKQDAFQIERQELKYSLEANQQCISIFINIFYAQ